MYRFLIAALFLFLAVPAFADDYLFSVGPEVEGVTVSGTLVGSGIKDPEVEALLAKNKELYAPDKWEGYVEFTGKPGTSRSIGQSDLLVPLWQDKNDMSFFNLRGMTENFDGGDFSIGFGHRHQFDDFIIGAYGYFDGSELEQGFYYHQWSTGIEVLGDEWDFRVNGYIADNDIKEIFAYTQDEAEVVLFKEDDIDKIRVDYSRFESWKHEKSSSGFDMEVGYKLPIFEDTRIYAGLYHFIGKQGFEDVTGPRIRIETRLYDLPYLGAGSRIMAGIETQSDDVRGGQTTGLVSLRVPFGVESKKPRSVLKGLDRRMMEPVIKNTNIITTQKEENHFRSASAEALDPYGKVYTEVMYADSSQTMEEIMADAKVKIDKGTPLVLIKQDELETPFEVSSAPIIAGATFAMAGTHLHVKYFNAFANTKKDVRFTPEGNKPVFEFTSALDSAIFLEAGSHINGFDIDASEHLNGFQITDSGEYHITGFTIQNAKKVSIKVNNKDAVVYLADGDMRASQKYGGIDIFAGKVYAEYLNIFDHTADRNLSTGAYVEGVDSYLEIKNSTIRNVGSGLYAGYGGTIIADNMLITKDISGGLSSRNGSYLKITNSTISYSWDWSAIVTQDSTMYLENVNIFGSPKGGVGVYDDGVATIVNSTITHNAIGVYTTSNGELIIINSDVSSNDRLNWP